ncbi:MAG: ribonuclease HII [Candidatus Krumholzibacteria bacterium]|nr:ribonuclease HII [Candidatus Krumholzibacteria bacterium]MDP6669883.1 ribonuclease HII [Candidatus Krumholzibacteria bacterium]MDP6796809.1 ribonuclease HII [Candidatus Krumholzibacteria bacterium]MDP7021059.1 ribonuclease HII [Candidatus Krumholzibacteria bacterium]
MNIDRDLPEVPVFSWDKPESFLASPLPLQRKYLESLPFEEREPWILLLEKDPRKGRQNLASLLRRQEAGERLLLQRFRELRDFDRDRAKGRILAGVDEVGRGPLAGPVTAAAVILPRDFHAPGLDDSKKLGPAAREKWAEEIRKEALAWAIADLPAGEIDRVGIRKAVDHVMREAVMQLPLQPELLLVDGNHCPSGLPPSEAHVGGDRRSLSIAAASVLAKVHRDRWMKSISLQYPDYGFDSHKGYGSSSHEDAIRLHGPCPIHRRSFLGRILEEKSSRSSRKARGEDGRELSGDDRPCHSLKEPDRGSPRD